MGDFGESCRLPPIRQAAERGRHRWNEAIDPLSADADPRRRDDVPLRIELDCGDADPRTPASDHDDAVVHASACATPTNLYLFSTHYTYCSTSPASMAGASWSINV